MKLPLSQFAEASPDVWQLLMSDSSNREVARQLGYDEKNVRRWRKKHRVDGPEAEEPADGDGIETFSTQDRQQLHRKLDELLDETNAAPGAVRGMRVATWDAMHKDDLGVAVKTRMYGVKLDSARWMPEWPVVQQAQPVCVGVQLPERTPIEQAYSRKAIILPDPQIGYRLYEDGTYDPFHDAAALDVALQIIHAVDPDLIILLGDYLDLAPFGKYEQEAAFARTTQKALDFGHEYLATIRAITGAEMVLLEGNHDRRLEKMVTRNAMEAFGLRRAGDVTGWPVLSLPHLLRLDELGVGYIGGYPAGSYWINDRLKCIHGSVVRSSGSTAKAVSDAERVSVIFGHIHRVETQYRTSDVREGGHTRLAHTPGCLCRIDGAVPSVKGSTDLRGRPVEHYEDWQQGLSVVSYEPGDGPFALESVFINTLEGHKACYGGRIYQPGAFLL